VARLGVKSVIGFLCKSDLLGLGKKVETTFLGIDVPKQEHLVLTYVK
jgi:hypothetical protein